MMSNVDRYETLLEMGVSKETIDIVAAINGFNQTTLEDILYVVAGYRDFEQLDWARF